jgi:hypothetical protein
MKGNLPWSARNLIRTTPIFQDEKDRQFLPLQAADMLAWHVRREHEVCAAPERLPMADLLRSAHGHLVSEIDEPMMKRWAEHHSKLPGIPLLQSKGQWRAIKTEIERISSLGIDPSTVGRRRNFFQRAGEHIARVFRR